MSQFTKDELEYLDVTFSHTNYDCFERDLRSKIKSMIAERKGDNDSDLRMTNCLRQDLFFFYGQLCAIQFPIANESHGTGYYDLLEGMDIQFKVILRKLGLMVS